MWKPFRRKPGEQSRFGALRLGGKDAGAYTVEISDVGTGHYEFDPNADCQVHSRRLEPWCDISSEATAREELHWHCLMLSERGATGDEVQEIGDQIITGRRDRIVAEGAISDQAEMAKLKGIVETAPSRIDAARTEAADAASREEELRGQAEKVRGELRTKRAQHDALPPRARISITMRMTVAISASFFLFDLGIIGSAFELISGDIQWKILLAVGVSLAPLSTAIGIAVWLSAAEHPIREGLPAGRLALIAGIIGIIGLGLIVLFRAEAVGDGVIPARAFTFLAFLQISLAVSETMLYTVYFDSRVGVAMRKEIDALASHIEELGGLAEREHARKERAEQSIGAIEEEATAQGDLLNSHKANSEKALEREKGTAEMLQGIVRQAIAEGELARQRRERREMEAAVEEPAPAGAHQVAYASMAIAALAVVLTGMNALL